MSKEFRPRLNQYEWNIIQAYRKVSNILCKILSKITFRKCCDKDCKK